MVAPKNAIASKLVTTNWALLSNRKQYAIQEVMSHLVTSMASDKEGFVTRPITT